MENYEWENCVSNLEMGWTNQWAFMDNREQLLAYKKEALARRNLFAKKGYDVKSVYEQLDEFDKCVKKQKTLTDDEEEGIILAALEYCQNNRPIIISHMNNALSLINTRKEREQSSLRYKFDIFYNLIWFYLGYKDTIELFDVILKFLEFNKSIIDKYPTEKQNYYCGSAIIYYLKYLVKSKQFDKARFILEKFDIEPIGKTDTTALEKIKEKISATKKIGPTA